jgi:hypothetical protein
LTKGRIVDLSHKMYPGREEYGLELATHFTDEFMPQYKRNEDVWYIMQDIRMSCRRCPAARLHQKKAAGGSDHPRAHAV